MQDRISKVNQSVQGAGNRKGKYLTFFTLAGEDYGIGILVDSISEVLTQVEIGLLEKAA
jgi:hypothetical protein